MKRLFKTLMFTIAICAVFGGLGYTIAPYFQEKDTHTIQAATIVKPAKTLGEFTLIDTNNQTFTKQSLLGHWTVLFFGYTHCPDVCPMTLTTLRAIWELFPQNKPVPIRFYFMSVDPNRDSCEKLKTYLTQFNRDFMGLTGTQKEIVKLIQPLGIFATDAKDKSGNAIIEHSATLMLINPQGCLAALFSPPFEPELIAKELQLLTH